MIEKRNKVQTPNTPAPRHQRPPASSDRAKATAALVQIGSGLTTFSERAFSYLTSPQSNNVNDTPRRLESALKALNAEKVWLPMDLRIKLSNIFERDKAAVIAYRSMDPDDKEYRRTWILEKLGIKCPPDYDILSDTLLVLDPFSLYLPTYNSQL